MKLTNWAIVALSASPYQAPELATKGLHGTVYGSTTFEDGAEITTSAIRRVEVDGPLLFVHTNSGSLYELGDVDPGYEAAYPGAAERLAKMARSEE